jgi:predicted nuclease of restriction endonuclease-like (RecB) superfamily
MEAMTEPRDLALPTGYTDLLGELKDRVRAARTKALRTVNTQLIELYWSIGRTIFWNFAEAWPGFDTNVPQPVGHLPSGHICTILDKRLEPEARDWYAAAAVDYGGSRNVLMNMIMNRTRERTGAVPSNIVQQLVAPDSELAQRGAKYPYNSEFLDLSGEVAERDSRTPWASRSPEPSANLGPGFSFVGQQAHFDVDGGDGYYVDLLFFHIEPSRHFVIELKTGKFEPEYAGKLNFYIALVDDRPRQEAHAPRGRASVGIGGAPRMQRISRGPGVCLLGTLELRYSHSGDDLTLDRLYLVGWEDVGDEPADPHVLLSPDEGGAVQIIVRDKDLWFVNG